MNAPRFSVVVPTYNRGHLIEQTLESVFEQSFSDYEIIVIDDGSTDKTPEVMKRYDGRVQYTRQANQGPGAARNAGIHAARGEYIAFLDSDDAWFPWTLEVFDAAIAESRNPAMLLGTQHNFRDASELGQVRRMPLQYLRFDDYYASVGVHDFFAATGNLVVKRSEALRTLGFPTNVRCSEDAHFMLTNGLLPGFCGITAPFTYGLRRSDEARVTNEARSCLEGASFLCRQERIGAYPGGELCKPRRLKFICDLASDSSLSCVYQGAFAGAYRVYRQILWWQLQRRDFRYVVGFHAVAGKAMLRKAAALWLPFLG